MIENLLTLADTNADSGYVTWSGGVAYFDLNGTIDTATVTISIDIGGGYNTNTDLAIDALGVYSSQVNIPQGALVKAVLSSVGGSTSVTLIISG